MESTLKRILLPALLTAVLTSGAPLISVATAQDFLLAPLQGTPLKSEEIPPDIDCNPKTACSKVDYAITNIEITQSTQCLDPIKGDINTFCKNDLSFLGENQIPLVIGKPTLIRVYVRRNPLVPPGTAIQRTPDVTLELLVTRGGTVVLDTIAHSTVFTKSSTPNRDKIGDSASFVFLCQICQDGDRLRVDASVGGIVGPEDPNPSDNSMTVDGPVLIARSPIFIEARRIDLMGKAAPDVATIANQHIFLRDAFPVGTVAYNTVHTPLSLTECVECIRGGAANAEWVANLIHIEVMMRRAFCGPSRFGPRDCGIPDQIVAWLPGNTFKSGGEAFPLWFHSLGVVAVVDSSQVHPQDGSTVMAHEIAHNLGRKHPSGPGGFPEQDLSWPYIAPNGYAENCDSKSVNIQETGVRYPTAFPGDQITRPGDLPDLMIGSGRCSSIDPYPPGKGWLSPYTYHQLLCALSPNREESFASRRARTFPEIGAPEVTFFSPLGQCLREPQPMLEIPSQPIMIVSGRIEVDGTGAFESIYRLTSRSSFLELDPGPFCLKLVKTVQTVPITLSQQCFNVSFVSIEAPPGAPPRPAKFSVTLPFVDGGTQVVLENNGQTVASVALSTGAPQVGPVDLVGTQLQWTATDPDGNPLAFTVFYSPHGNRPDDARHLIPLAVNSTNMSLPVDLNELPGGQHAFFRILATDNQGQTSIADSAHFVVPKKPPRAFILAPQPGGRFAQGSAVVLRGDFDDLEDIQLPDDGFLWSSDRDGSLGLGPTIGTDTLSLGQHIITLIVTDTHGLKDQAQVTLSIHLPCDIDGNNSVDRNDISAIFAARNTPAPPGDPHDVDGDGEITVEDARLCALRCTNPECAP